MIRWSVAYWIKYSGYLIVIEDDYSNWKIMMVGWMVGWMEGGKLLYVGLGRRKEKRAGDEKQMNRM